MIAVKSWPIVDRESRDALYVDQMSRVTVWNDVALAFSFVVLGVRNSLGGKICAHLLESWYGLCGVKAF